MGRLTSMNFHQGLVVVGVLWGYGGVYGIDCINATLELSKCFPQSSDYSQAQIIGIPGVLEHCGSEILNEFTTGLRCQWNLMKLCPQQFSSASRKYAIDPSTTMKGIDYLCQHTQDIDWLCLNQSARAVERCATRKEMEHQNDAKTKELQLCKSITIAEQCFSEEYSECLGKTKDIVLHFQRNYNVPPACRGCMNIVSPLLLLVVFLFICVHGACSELQALLTA